MIPISRGDDRHDRGTHSPKPAHGWRVLPTAHCASAKAPKVPQGLTRRLTLEQGRRTSILHSRTNWVVQTRVRVQGYFVVTFYERTTPGPCRPLRAFWCHGCLPGATSRGRSSTPAGPVPPSSPGRCLAPALSRALETGPVDALLKALRAVPCLYARTAEVHCCLQQAPPANVRASWYDHLQSTATAVTNLAPSVDVLAVEIPVPASALPSGLLAAGVHTVLAGLVYCCQSETTQLYDGIETSRWEYTIATHDFFPFVLSPVYSLDHPRHLAWRQPVLLLQPEVSFTRHGISSSSPGRASVSTLIESSFHEAGKRYYAAITRDFPKAFRVVKPLRETDAPVRWWETTLLTDLTTLRAR